MIVVIVVFAFGGIANYCDTHTDSASKGAYAEVSAVRAKEKKEHRQNFFNKYKRALYQFDTEADFSFWLDNRANYEAIIFMYDSIISINKEYDYEEGIADMISYLGWTEPDIIYKYEYDE